MPQWARMAAAAWAAGSGAWQAYSDTSSVACQLARLGVLMPSETGDADGGGDQIFPLRPQLSGGIEGFNPAVLLAAVAASEAKAVSTWAALRSLRWSKLPRRVLPSKAIIGRRAVEGL